MLIRIFRQDNLSQYLFFILFAFALWLPTFINPPHIYPQNNNSPFYNLFIQISNSKLVWAILAFIFLISQSFIFNTILTKNEIIRKNSMLGILLYFTLMSHHSSFQIFHPVLICNFFLLYIIYLLLKMYGREDVLRDSFRLGFILGLSSMFFFPSIFFFFFIFLTLLLYRVSQWRQWVIPIFSFISLYQFLFIYYLLTNDLNIFLTYFDDFFTNFSIAWPYSNLFSLIILLAIASITFIAFWGVLLQNQIKSIQIRKKIHVFFYFFLISIISLLITNYPINIFTTFLIPIAVTLTIYFNDLRKFFWIEAIFVTIIVLIFLNIY